MTAVPHLVLDGALAAAAAVGAREVIVTVPFSAVRTHHALAVAVAERSDGVPITIVDGPGGYVSGEETALVQGLERRRPVPTFTPPRPYERGYDHRPTLIQNAETLAHLALIARFGARWFRALGTNADPGTALTTLSGAVRNPGVYEIPFGTVLSDLVDAAGGLSEPMQAVLIGGYFGTWAGAREARTLALAPTALEVSSHALGAGVLVVLGQSDCGLHASAALARYLADQSAGQCGPCVYGLRAIADDFTALIDSGDPRLRARIERTTDLVDGRGACAHPNGAVRLIRSALQVFGDEVSSHHHHCRGRSAGMPGLGPTGRSAARR